jgi:hypothetical protein
VQGGKARWPVSAKGTAQSIIAARVVLLSDVTLISPRGISAMTRNVSPMPSSSIDSAFDGTVRKAPQAQRLTALARKWAIPGISNAKLRPKNSSYFLILFVVHYLVD